MKSSYRVMAGGLLAAALCLVQPAQAAPYEKLVLAGPTAAVSFPLIHMVESGALAGWADQVEFRHWKNPDQLRVLLAKQQVDFSATPVNLPAIMANRGLPVRLLNVSVWGLLWFISSDPAIQSVADLAGQPLLTTFQRDLPALLLERLLVAEGLTGDKAPQLRYARDAQDATALMLTGEAPNLLLPEPSVSLLLARNAQQGKQTIHRVQSLEDAWHQAFPQQPDLPQAGIMVNSHRADDEALSQAVAQAYTDATLWCKAQPAQCAREVHRHLDFLPVEAIEASIQVTRLESRDASSVRPALEALYELILANNPEAVGGQLPAPGFYGP
ncbi:ABC transporter substrate-binding protein [Castellaniella sp.]|uniref:ABC transporter substrate-binding protein n=1 Tax=Castellaniella sp. TaxID=1955812 RepID=UPI002AFEDC4D|nr:ABC transporter substrate-binding protein [Castellaniella sp.]